MMKRFSFIIFVGIFGLIGGMFFLAKHTIVDAAATHVVISQIQVHGLSDTSDQFVELYNPTSNAINLAKWRLVKESSTGGSPTNLVASISGTIASHGYFLIAHPHYTGVVTPDKFYSATTSAFTTNNTVLLYSDAGITLVDKVGMGTATDKESTDASNPTDGGSIQRKLDDTGGHGLDTDTNGSDFETLVTSDPRNSSTIVFTPTPTFTPVPTATPTFTPTPTVTPTPTATATPTPSFTPTPTDSPTPTVTPTNTPTPTPTNSPTPTLTPTLIPTNSPTPTFTPTPSASPTITPTMAPSLTPTETATPTPSVSLEPSMTVTPTILASSPTPTVLASSPFPTRRPDKDHDRDDHFPHITWKWEFHRFHIGKWEFEVPFCHFHIDRH